MRKSKLIKDTTREERIAIVTQGLNWTGDSGSSCESCSGCSFGAPRIDAMYQPYIDGEMELAEINMRNAATKYTHG